MSYTGAAMWLAHQQAGSGVRLSTVDTWADIAQKAMTAVAVIAGGLWAYFNFAKGRVFRPRVEVDMSGQWVRDDGRTWLRARIRVRNIGASKISLRQEGTGLRVSTLAAAQPPAPAGAAWERRKTFAILTKHAWIEPGETVSDDILIDLGGDPGPIRFESRLVIPRKVLSNVAVSASQVVAGDTAAGTATRSRRMQRWRTVIPSLGGNHQTPGTSIPAKNKGLSTSTSRQKTSRKPESGSPRRTDASTPQAGAGRPPGQGR